MRWSTQHTVSLRVSSRIEWVDVIEALATDLSHALGFSDSQRFDVSLAVREALSNAMVHGNATEPSKRVKLAFTLEDDALSMRISDEGAGFRVDDIPDPTRPENLLKPSGRGVFYIQSLMDEVDFSRTARAGGEFVMTKRLGAAVPSPESKPDPGGSMKTETKTVGNVTIIRPKGRITIGEGDVKLREAIEGCLDAGVNKIIIDLGKVSFMDSSGVGELVGCYATVTNRGGFLKLLNLTKKIHDLLQITQLVTVFEVFKDETEAISSFS